MRWLTDHPDNTLCLLPGDASWEPYELASRDRALTSIFPSNPDGIRVWSWEDPAHASPYPDRRIILVDQADASQFDQVMAALKKGQELPDGLVCMALTGKGFRGQRERPWSALRGNLHLTVHYELGIAAQENQGALTMLPAIASSEAVAGLVTGGPAPEIKWVNDVLLNGKKVSGVLTATHLSGRRVDRAVFGIGVNVRQAPEIEATPFVPAAGSLAEIDPGLAGALPALFSDLVLRLDELVACLRAGRRGELFERYAGKAGFINRDVRVWPEGTVDWRSTEPIARGRVNGLNEDLSLNIAGVDEPVRSGRMAFEENC